MSRALLALFFLPLIALPAAAKDPFKPLKVLPSCSVSVMMGAQQAFDNFAGPLVVAYEKSKYNYPVGEHPTSTQLRLAIEKYRIQNNLIKKSKELEDFAKEKYKCKLYLQDSYF